VGLISELQEQPDDLQLAPSVAATCATATVIATTPATATVAVVADDVETVLREQVCECECVCVCVCVYTQERECV